MGHILEKIKALIARSLFCVFDISSARPNIFFELGFAHGINKPHILICERGAEIPSDLAGYEVMIYDSYGDLEKIIKKRVPEIVNLVSQYVPRRTIGTVDLIRPMVERLKRSPASMNELLKIATDAGFTKVDVDRVLAGFKPMLEMRGRKLILRKDAIKHLERLLSQMD